MDLDHFSAVYVSRLGERYIEVWYWPTQWNTGPSASVRIFWLGESHAEATGYSDYSADLQRASIGRRMPQQASR